MKGFYIIYRIIARYSDEKGNGNPWWGMASEIIR